MHESCLGRGGGPKRDEHEVMATGREPLRTLNVYVPPAYTKGGVQLPAAKG